MSLKCLWDQLSPFNGLAGNKKLVIFRDSNFHHRAVVWQKMITISSVILFHLFAPALLEPDDTHVHVHLAPEGGKGNRHLLVLYHLIVQRGNPRQGRRICWPKNEVFLTESMTLVVAMTRVRESIKYAIKKTYDSYYDI